MLAYLIFMWNAKTVDKVKIIIRGIFFGFETKLHHAYIQEQVLI